MKLAREIFQKKCLADQLWSWRTFCKERSSVKMSKWN